MSSSSSLLSGITIYHIDKINPVMYDICETFITYQCDAVSFYVNTFGTLERDVGFYNNFTQEDSGQRPADRPSILDGTPPRSFYDIIEVAEGESVITYKGEKINDTLRYIPNFQLAIDLVEVEAEGFVKVYCLSNALRREERRKIYTEGIYRFGEGTMKRGMRE